MHGATVKIQMSVRFYRRKYCDFH